MSDNPFNILLKDVFTPAGVNVPSAEDIMAALQTRMTQVFGINFNLDTTNPVYIINQAVTDLLIQTVSAQQAQVADMTYSTLGVRGAVIMSSFFNTPFGEGTPSTAVAKITGTVGFIVPKGTILKDQTGNLWQTDADLVISTVEVDNTVVIQSTLNGAYNLVVGETLLPTTYIPSINTVTCITSPVVGTPALTVQQWKALQRKTLAKNAFNTRIAMEAALNDPANVPGVVEAKVYENATDSTNSYGMPSRTLYAFILGGQDEPITNTVFTWRSEAVVMLGDSHPYIDSQGYLQQVYWERPTAVSINIKASIQAVSGTVPTTLPETVKLALLKTYNQFQIGASITQSEIAKTIQQVIGSAYYINGDVLISLGTDPVANVDIVTPAFNEFMLLIENNIEIDITP